MKKIVLYIIMWLSAAGAYATKPFFDTSAADRLVRVAGVASVGNSMISQNYKSCFPEISELSVAAGWNFGVGGQVEFGVRDFLAVGTGIRLQISNTAADIMAESENEASISNVFLRNHYYTLNFPIYVSFKFNVAPTVRWNVDGGLYYSYGLAGHQKQNIFSTNINALGQLVSIRHKGTVDYYNDREAFLNSSYRGDVGLHLATGLTFKEHYQVGAQMQAGFKNVANTVGTIHPNIHNLSFQAVVAYWF